jgi:hypothetical protein
LLTFWPPGPDDLLKLNSPMLLGIVSACNWASHLRAAWSSSGLASLLLLLLLLPEAKRTAGATASSGRVVREALTAGKRARSMLYNEIAVMQCDEGAAPLRERAVADRCRALANRLDLLWARLDEEKLLVRGLCSACVISPPRSCPQQPLPAFFTLSPLPLPPSAAHCQPQPSILARPQLSSLISSLHCAARPTSPCRAD